MSTKILATATLVLAFGFNSAQVIPTTTEKTKTLYSNLKIIQNSPQFLFGQEFFNSFRFSSGSAHGEKDYSDSKAVTGSHPAVLGSDFHYYLEKDATERSYHTEAVKWAYQQGYAITFDWHISGRNSATYQYNTTNKDLVNNIVNDLNGDRAWLYEQFDKVIEIINNDLVVDNERIPIVFRPWHEMNGGWFWWGSQATSVANYKTLYQLTVEYFKTRTTSVLFCWSPNTPTNMSHYPGDNYVDVLGLDIYELTASTLRTNLAPIVDYAQEHGKVAVLSETGNRTNNGDNAAAYWKDMVLPAIINDPTHKAGKIAWVLTWINSSWSYPYVPHALSSAAAKQSFIDFKNSTNVLFGSEIPNLYLPMEVPLATAESVDSNDITLFPLPTAGDVTLKLRNFRLPAIATVYNAQGQVVGRLTITSPESRLKAGIFNGAGVYVVRVSDGFRTASKKVVIE